MAIFGRVWGNNRENGAGDVGSETGAPQGEIDAVDSGIDLKLHARVTGLEQIVAYLDNKVDGFQKVVNDIAEMKEAINSMVIKVDSFQKFVNEVAEMKEAFRSMVLTAPRFQTVMDDMADFGEEMRSLKKMLAEMNRKIGARK
jgi:seryl-tRNA synthetase